MVQLSEVLKGGFGRLMGEDAGYNGGRIQESMDGYGQDGWELLSIIPTLERRGTSTNLLLLFKRPKE